MRWLILALALLWPWPASSQAPYMSAAFEELGAPGASTARLKWIQRGCVVRLRNEVATPIQCSWGGDIVVPLEGKPETAPAGGDVYRLFDGPYLLGEDQLPPVYYVWLPETHKEEQAMQSLAIDQLTATWSPSHLVIHWQAAESVCVWLTGGDRQDQPLPVACGVSGSAELGVSGDSQYVPQEREWIELRNANSQTVERLAVPERPPEVWLAILPLVDIP